MRDCAFVLNGMPTSVHLNVLSLGSYSMLLSKDWFYLYWKNKYWYEKAIKCLDDNGDQRIFQGKKKATLVRMVTTMQEKNIHRKRCVLFVVHIPSDKGKDVGATKVLDMYPVL